MVLDGIPDRCYINALHITSTKCWRKQEHQCFVHIRCKSRIDKTGLIESSQKGRVVSGCAKAAPVIAVNTSSRNIFLMRWPLIVFGCT